MKSRSPDPSLAARLRSRVAGWFGGAQRPGEPQAPAEPVRPTLPSHPPVPLRRRDDPQGQAAQDARPDAGTSPAADEGLDTLTGLATRARLETLQAQWHQELDADRVEFSVLRLTVGGLQPVIERYGAEAGDHVLVQIGKRLRQGARSTDRVFRLEGDEFLVLLRCPAGQAAALAGPLATRLVGNLQRPFTYRTLSSLRLQCSAGSAVWPLDSASLAEVVTLAEHALLAATSAGAGQVRQHIGAAL